MYTLNPAHSQVASNRLSSGNLPGPRIRSSNYKAFSLAGVDFRLSKLVQVKCCVCSEGICDIL